MAFPAVDPLECLEHDVVRYLASRELAVVHSADDLDRRVVMVIISTDQSNENTCIDDSELHPRPEGRGFRLEFSVSNPTLSPPDFGGGGEDVRHTSLIGRSDSFRTLAGKRLI